jgi:hypothetical protein
MTPGPDSPVVSAAAPPSTLTVWVCPECGVWERWPEARHGRGYRCSGVMVPHTYVLAETTP